MAEIIPIDISKIEAEIAKNEQTIKDLQQRNILLQQFKGFAYQQKDQQAKPTLPTPPADLGVSAFIEWFLGQVDEASAKYIGEEWAVYGGEDYEDIKTTVSNALNRLKNDIGTIDSRALGVGRKDGYLYFLRR